MLKLKQLGGKLVVGFVALATLGFVFGYSGGNALAANAAPTISVPATASPSPVAAKTTTLNVRGADDGGANKLKYAWSIVAKPSGANNPTFSRNNTNLASTTVATFSKAGDYTFKVVISDTGTPSLNVSTNVSVTVSQTLTKITVSPNSVNLKINSTQSFTASALDQFGATMSAPLTWSVVGNGSVDATGLYNAPAVPATDVVKASSGAISGTASVSVFEKIGAFLVPPMPVVSSGKPAYASSVSGSNVAANANGAIYDVFGYHDWISASVPASLTYDLSSVPTANRGVVDVVWYNIDGAYDNTVGAGGTPIGAPKDYTIEGNAAPTGTAEPASGWVVLATVIGNRFSSRQHVVDLTGYNWIRINVSSVVSGTQVDLMHFDVHDLSQSNGLAKDSWIFFGDSITQGGTNYQEYYYGSPNNSSIAQLVKAQMPAYFPAQQDGGVSSAGTAEAAANIDEWLSVFPGNFVGLSYGTNDVGYMSSSTYYDYYAIMVQKIINAGKVPVVSKVPWGKTSSVQTYAPAFNAKIDLLYANFPQVMRGPDFWTYFKNNPSLINSGDVHPGSTGYAVMKKLWAQVMVVNAYTVDNSAPNAAPTVATAAAANPTVVTGVNTTLSVLGADDGGENNLTYTWSVSSKPAGVADPTYSVNGTNAAKNTVATFKAAGSYTFSVTIRDAFGLTAVSSVSVQVSQTVSRVTVSPSSATVAINGTQVFSAALLDQFNNAVAASVTWSVVAGGAGGTVDATGLYTAPATIGSDTVNASLGSLTSSATVTVTAPNTAPVISSATANPSLVTGVSTNLSVAATDDNGVNNLSYSWSLVSKPAGALDPVFSAATLATTQVTFSSPGDYQFAVTVKDSGNLTATANVLVTVSQTAGTLTVTPNTANVVINNTQQFTATTLDQFGSSMAVSNYVWAVSAGGVGGVVTSGLYIAPGVVGSDTVTVSANSLTASAVVNVIPPPNQAPTVATPAASNPATVAGNTANLSVLGADDAGEANLTYTWSVTSKPTGATNPMFSTNGNNAAKNTTVTFSKSGTYNFTVVIADSSGLNISSSVGVVVAQTVNGVFVSPTSTQVAFGSTKQLVASALDQFGDPMVTTYSWSVLAGGVGGSISSTGLYTAPSTAGTDMVSVTANGQSAYTAVAVYDPGTGVQVAAIPLISTNKPAFSSSGSGASDANGLIYDIYNYHSWISTAVPAWLAYDLSSVSAANRGKVEVVWYNSADAYDPTIGSGGSYDGLPKDYTIEVNAAPGGTTPTTGWVTLATVTNNRFMSREHTIDMTGYNWIRLNVSAIQGTGSAVKIMHFDVHDLSASAGIPQDSWIFYGDSITLGGTDYQSYYWGSTNNTTIAQHVNASAPQHFPIAQDAGVVGAGIGEAVIKMDEWLAAYPGKFVDVSYGTNDAAYISSSTYYDNLVTLVTKITNAGKIPVVSKMPWGNWSGVLANGPAFNAKIDLLYQNYPQIIKGPDFWTFFYNNQNLINSGDVHPTDDGYAAMKKLWADVILRVYSTGR